jgi:hypothetical protein
MEGDLLCLLSPLWGFAANVLTQILRARRPGASLLKSIFVGFFVGAIVCAGSDVLLAARGPATSLPLIQVLPFNLFLYGMIGYCYFHTVNLAVTARRIRILRGIFLAPEPPRLEDILREYNSGDMVHKRIDRLLKSGQIIQVDGRYHIQPGALLGMTLALRALKRCVYGKGSGHATAE